VALRVVCPAAPDCCAVSPDGTLLAWGDAEGRVRVADLFTGRLFCLFRGHPARVASVAFTENGRALVSGSADTTCLVWAVPPRLHGAALSPRQLARLWDDLGGTDVKKAHRACGALRSAPARSVPFLAGRLRPVAAPDPARVRRLLADLGSDSFAVREKATAELEQIGDQAEPALRRALEGKPSAEMRRRVDSLLDRKKEPSPERLRQLRALEALEHADAPEARDFLRRLAKGAPEAWLTKEAKAALARGGR